MHSVGLMTPSTLSRWLNPAGKRNTYSTSFLPAFSASARQASATRCTDSMLVRLPTPSTIRSSRNCRRLPPSRCSEGDAPSSFDSIPSTNSSDSVPKLCSLDQLSRRYCKYVSDSTSSAVRGLVLCAVVPWREFSKLVSEPGAAPCGSPSGSCVYCGQPCPWHQRTITSSWPTRCSTGGI